MPVHLILVVPSESMRASASLRVVSERFVSERTEPTEDHHEVAIDCGAEGEARSKGLIPRCINIARLPEKQRKNCGGYPTGEVRGRGGQGVPALRAAHRVLIATTPLHRQAVAPPPPAWPLINETNEGLTC